MKLSIVVTFCDRDFKYLVECIQNIKRCMHTANYELLLVDNRNDRTTKVPKFPGIKYIEASDPDGNKKNTYPYWARALAVSYCEGDYVWYIDVDDSIIENDYDTLLSLVNENTDVVAFNYLVDDKPIQSMPINSYEIYDPECLFLSKTPMHKLITEIGNCCWNKWFKLSVLKANIKYAQYYELAICEDTLWLYLALFNSHTLQLIPYYSIYNYNKTRSSVHAGFTSYTQYLEGVEGIFNIEVLLESLFPHTVIEDSDFMDRVKNIQIFICCKILDITDKEIRKSCYDHFSYHSSLAPNTIAAAIIANSSLSKQDRKKLVEKLSYLAGSKLDNLLLKSPVLNTNKRTEIVINAFNFYGYLEKHPIAQACIQSWKKAMPYAKIKIWTIDDLKDIILQHGFSRFAYNSGYKSYIGDVVRIYLSLITPNFLYLDLDTFICKDLAPLLELDAFTIGFPAVNGSMRCNYGCIYWQKDFSELSFNLYQKYISDEFEFINSTEKLFTNDACTFSESVIDTCYIPDTHRQLVQGSTLIHRTELDDYCVHAGLSVLNPVKDMTDIYYSFKSTFSLRRDIDDLKDNAIKTVFIINAVDGYIESFKGVEFRYLVMPKSLSKTEILDLFTKEVTAIKGSSNFNLKEV